jgi:hypothetical protein
MYAVKKPKPQPPTPDKDDTSPDQMTRAFLREVDDALHEERLKALWQAWRLPLIGGVVALFVFVGGREIWQSRTSGQQQAAANAWYDIVTAEKEEQATEQLADLSKSPVLGGRLLGVFEQGRRLAEAGQTDQAAEAYEKIADDDTYPYQFRALAELYAAMALMTTHPQEAESRFAAMDDVTHPYRATALEMMAELSENKNDRATALALWEKLLEIPNVPPSLRERATQRAEDIRRNLK